MPPIATATSPLPHIVVLGAGFAGLSFCQKLPSGVARITLVDRQNHHLFQPLLYQVATAGLSAPDIAQPIRTLLRDKPDLTVLMAEVQGVDLAGRRVTLDRGTLDYDYLVIGLGGRTSYFAHPEWEPFAPGLKSLDDALRVRRQILTGFERAETESDPDRRQAWLTTVVVGGGPTGVELAGTCAELAHTVLARDFDHIDPRSARVVLVEGGDRVLSNFPADLSASAQRQLEHLGVEVKLGVRVQSIREGEVDLPGETLRAGTILWAAGVGAVELTRGLGVETDRGGRIKVLPDTSVPGHPEVFAVGDLAALVDAKGVTVPGVAQGAMQMAAHAAKIIAAEQRHGRVPVAQRPAFAYRDKGNMATIGRSAAVAQLGRMKFSGYPAWVLWLTVHLLFLIGFRNRLTVLIQWVYSYLTYGRGARIITGVEVNAPAPALPVPVRPSPPV